MSKFPWKTAIAGAAILAATVFAYAQLSSDGGPMGHGMMGCDMRQMHQQMMQGTAGMQGGMGQGMHGGMSGGIQGGMGQGMQGGMHGEMGMGGMHQRGAMNGASSSAGDTAFGAIQDVVQMLERDRSTDWSKVNIAALREHLIDMNEVTLHAAAAERVLDGGIEIAVTGEGRTLQAIKRMVPAHVRELAALGWAAKSDELPNGVKLTITTTDAQRITKLKALGFAGIMVQGAHHQPHHLMMAKGEFTMH